jgi:hypothetical protein
MRRQVVFDMLKKKLLHTEMFHVIVLVNPAIAVALVWGKILKS